MGIEYSLRAAALGACGKAAIQRFCVVLSCADGGSGLFDQWPFGTALLLIYMSRFCSSLPSLPEFLISFSLRKERVGKGIKTKKEVL